jgi:hypothetical protein
MTDKGKSASDNADPEIRNDCVITTLLALFNLKIEDYPKLRLSLENPSYCFYLF